MVILVAMPLAGLAAWGEIDGGQGQPSPGSIELRVGDRSLGSLPLRRFLREGRLDRGSLSAAVVERLPATVTMRRGRARIVYRLNRRTAARRAARAGLDGATIRVQHRAVSSAIGAPVVAQRLRNNCETAALQVLLATLGTRVGQARLQSELPQSAPVDPRGSEGGQVWGDPDLGFVGRVDGTGLAGGFGVYPGPIAALAKRHGQRLSSLTGASVGAVYARLLQGRAVLAWVGLADGPYGQWRTPAGRTVKVNFNEHTVVLNGARPDGGVLVVNPLEGTREVWTRAKFENMWRRLGRRALST